MRAAWSAVVVLATTACGNALAPTRAVESVFVTDDAIVARVGGPRAAPESFEGTDRIVNVLDGEKARFPPTDPRNVKLVAGDGDEEAYVVLGIVTGGEGGGLGKTPSYVAALKRAAASIGADTVLDVHVEGWGLTGIAARRRAAANDRDTR